MKHGRSTCQHLMLWCRTLAGCLNYLAWQGQLQQQRQRTAARRPRQGPLATPDGHTILYQTENLVVLRQQRRGRGSSEVHVDCWQHLRWRQLLGLRIKAAVQHMWSKISGACWSCWVWQGHQQQQRRLTVARQQKQGQQQGPVASDR
jgi:hypothetical protein